MHKKLVGSHPTKRPLKYKAKQSGNTCIHCSYYSLCSTEFRVNMNGLRNSRFMKLQELKHQTVKVVTNDERSYRGTLTYVGKDFISLQINKTFLFLSFDQIKDVRLC